MNFKIESMEKFEPTELNLLIYGEGKVGKTMLTLTLPKEDHEKTLYLGVDPGHIVLRGSKINRVVVKDNVWDIQKLKGFYEFVRDQNPKPIWLIVDGLDDIGDLVVAERLSVNKDGRKGWDEGNKFMDAWIKSIRDISGVRKVFITHNEDINDGERLIHRPDMPGKYLKKELNRYFDIIAAMRIVTDEATGSNVHVLQCNRNMSSEWFCGDRTGILETFEDPNLGKIYSKVWDKIPSLKAVSAIKITFAAAVKDKEFFEVVKKYCGENKIKSLTELTEDDMRILIERR